MCEGAKDGRWKIEMEVGMNMKRMNLKFRFTLQVLLILCVLVHVTGCKTGGDNGENNNNGSSTTIQVTVQGSENTLEIATWNLEHFPLNGSSTIDKLAAIIRQLDIDIYAVQEIESTTSFRNLVDSLNGYEGLFSEHVYSGGDYQKTGIIYKQDMVTVLSSQLLFTGNDYAFPRPPLLLHMDVQKDGKHFDFFLVVIHLKAFSEPENVERRKAAALALKTYMDDKIVDQKETEKDYIVAGDWNDEIDDPPAENAFQVFIDAPGSYLFLTQPLAGDSMHASYPSWGSLIDHILISGDCFDEYTNGSCKTIRLDDQVSEYSVYISDHRPVMAVFPVF
jgi:endonuclease/exonuclease/phosphatase family metal-dependent hydrolase